MQVLSLSKFMRTYMNVLTKKRKLSNIKLVIDLDSLKYLLSDKLCDSKEHPNNNLFSADYVSFGEEVKLFFNTLNRCNITSILVSHEFYSIECDDKTEEQNSKRYAELQKKSNDGSKFIFSNNLVNKIIDNIVNDLNIEIYYDTTNKTLVKIANENECFILTRDFDVYLFDIKSSQGMIILDNFEYKNIDEEVDSNNKKKSFLLCNYYTHDLLYKAYEGLNLICLPLLELKLEFDYNKINQLEQPITVPTFSKSDDLRIHGTLNWFKGKSFEDLTHYIKTYTSTNQKNIDEVMKKYSLESVDDNFGDKLSLIYPTIEANSNDQSVRSIDKEKFINYFKHNIRSENFCFMPHRQPIYYEPMIRMRIKNDRMMRTHVLLSRPYSIISIFLRPTNEKPSLSIDKKIKTITDNFIDLYMGYNNDIKKRVIEPVDTFITENGDNNINIFSLFKMNDIEKRNLLMKIFRFNIDEFDLFVELFSRIFSKEFANEASLCFLLYQYVIIEYFLYDRKNHIIETDYEVDKEFVDALILTFIYHASINNLLNEKLLEDEKVTAIINIKKYDIFWHSRSRFNANLSTGYLKIYFQSISDLMTTYSIYCDINNLFENVFHVPRFEKFFNVPMICSIMESIYSDRLDINLFYENLNILKTFREDFMKILNVN